MQSKYLAGIAMHPIFPVTLIPPKPECEFSKIAIEDQVEECLSATVSR